MSPEPNEVIYEDAFCRHVYLNERETRVEPKPGSDGYAQEQLAAAGARELPLIVVPSVAAAPPATDFPDRLLLEEGTGEVYCAVGTAWEPKAAADGAQGPPGTPGVDGAPGSQGIQGPPGPGATHVKLTADLAAATAVAMTNTTGLSFAVTAGVYYRFDALIVFRSAALTTGLRLGATVPAFTVYGASVEIPFAADAAAGAWHGALTTSGDSVVSTAVPAITTDYVARLSGVLLPSANGTFQIQHATEIAASGVTIRRGSVLSYSVV